ncbi:hypothetical protein FIV42_19270 [Persicimonas caeni]|uniref:Uncharacterized protein n=1 Tax=Persicimonas caeni TaxID=2292766 RepID=A0A4Y6PWW8_PERCE|nr:hypothetical protein [Persicimonas caeni]QDG52806.1 hypothetical protein FIV42_19270 [Persicimonas caeni]QED34028.1 hypothetical protein FRD00_19265 [Persicimonas caeni]
MPRLIVLMTVTAALLSACQTDLNVEELPFSCTGPSDCLSGFECVPVGDGSELKQCVRVGANVDASDATADARDVAQDAERDTSVDVGPDSADTSDVTDAVDTTDTTDTPSDADSCANITCSSGEQCVDGACVEAECTTDNECGFREVCEDNQCTSLVYGSIVIEDTTSQGALDCKATSPSPGADIFGVQLFAADGTPIAMGQVDEANLTPIAGNQYDDPSVINSATSATCTGDEQESPEYVSLGCNGATLRVVFSAAGSSIELTDGMVVEIGEYDSACDQFATDESYQVYKCTRSGDHCIVIASGLSGQSSVNL